MCSCLGGVLHELDAVVQKHAPLHLPCGTHIIRTRPRSAKLQWLNTSAQCCEGRERHTAAYDVAKGFDAAACKEAHFVFLFLWS